MFWRFFTHDFRISRKKFLAALFLFFPSFAWFFLFQQFLLTEIQNLLLNGNLTDFSPNGFWVTIGNIIFYVSIVSSAIVGSMISEKFSRRRFIEIWIILGIVTSILVTLNLELSFLLFIAALAGVSFGLGFPSSLAFFADSTVVEERARVSGALIFITFFSVILCLGIRTSLHLGFFESVLLFTILRAISIFSLLIDPLEKVVCKEKGWMSIFATHGLWLYYLSWLMFSVAGGIFGIIKLPLNLRGEDIDFYGTVLLYGGVIISSLISGFAADHFGRRRIIIFGLVTLGISYQVFSIALVPTSYLLTRLIYGVAWGIIFVAYMLTVIGDLALTCSKEKFYAIGVVVPIIVFMVFESFSGVLSPSLSISVISSILGILLFISTVPLLYAPETLPIDKIRRRRFEKHLKKVKKLVKDEKT